MNIKQDNSEELRIKFSEDPFIKQIQYLQNKLLQTAIPVKYLYNKDTQSGQMIYIKETQKMFEKNIKILRDYISTAWIEGNF